MKRALLEQWNDITREVSNWDLQIAFVRNAIQFDGMTSQRRARLEFVTKKYDEAIVKFHAMEKEVVS
jgi:hypothetical protein